MGFVLHPVGSLSPLSLSKLLWESLCTQCNTFILDHLQNRGPYLRSRFKKGRAHTRGHRKSAVLWRLLAPFSVISLGVHVYSYCNLTIRDCFNINPIIMGLREYSFGAPGASRATEKATESDSICMEPSKPFRDSAAPSLTRTLGNQMEVSIT